MLPAILFEATLFLFHYSFFPNLRLATFILELKSICLLDLISSLPQWYWASIIMYLHTDIIFYDAINMCCDQGTFSLTSHTCLLLAEACFRSVISVLCPNQFEIALIFDSPCHSFFFLFLNKAWLFGLLTDLTCTAASQLIWSEGSVFL